MTYTPTEQANIGVIHRLFAAEAAGDWDTYLSLWAPEVVVHIGDSDFSLHDFRAVVDRFRTTFIELSHTILDVSADGDVVTFRWRFHPVVRSTGKRLNWGGCHWMRLEGGQIVEDWNYGDTAEAQRQMSANQGENHG